MNKIILQVFIIINMMTSLLYGERMRLAILDFEAKEGISKATVTTASEWITTEMINTKHFTVIERTAMNEILQEQAFSTTGCTETSCAVKLGRLLSARKILIGSIAKWRKKIIINGRIIDVEKGVAEFAHKESISSLDDLDIGVSSFAKNLSKRIQGYTVNPSASNGKYSQNNLQPLTRLNKSFSGTWKTTYGKLIMTKNGNKVASSEGRNIEHIIPTGRAGRPVPS